MGGDIKLWSPAPSEQQQPMGVPPSQAPQIAQGPQASNELQFQDQQGQPSQQANVLATIMNMAALGSNIAGAATNRGAVGNSLVTSAQDIQDRSRRDEKQKLDVQQSQDASKALWPVAQKTFTGSRLEMARTLLSQGDWKSVESMISQQRLLGREVDKEERFETSQARGGLASMEKNIGEAEKSLKNSPEFAQGQRAKLIESMAVEIAKKHDSIPTREQIQNYVNTNASFKKQLGGDLSTEQAESIYSQINSAINKQKKPLMNNSFGVWLRDNVGMGSLPQGKTPKDLIAGVSNSLADPEMQKQLTSQLESLGAQKKEVQQIRLKLASKKTRREALDRVQEIFAGSPIGQQQEQQAPAVNPEIAAAEQWLAKNPKHPQAEAVRKKIQASKGL